METLETLSPRVNAPVGGEGVGAGKRSLESRLRGRGTRTDHNVPEEVMSVKYLSSTSVIGKGGQYLFTAQSPF